MKEKIKSVDKQKGSISTKASDRGAQSENDAKHETSTPYHLMDGLVCVFFSFVRPAVFVLFEGNFSFSVFSKDEEDVDCSITSSDVELKNAIDCNAMLRARNESKAMPNQEFVLDKLRTDAIRELQPIRCKR